jgi:hypothetical protein
LVISGQRLGRPDLARIVVETAGEVEETIDGPGVAPEGLLAQHRERALLG